MGNSHIRMQNCCSTQNWNSDLKHVYDVNTLTTYSKIVEGTAKFLRTKISRTFISLYVTIFQSLNAFKLFSWFLNCKASCQICSVRCHHNQRKEPPSCSRDASSETSENYRNSFHGQHSNRSSYLGAISDPCCSRAPVTNHNELPKPLNWFSNFSGSSMHGYGLSHSDGAIRPKKNRHSETPRYAPPKYPQTCIENGAMNEYGFGGSGSAFL